MPDRLKKIIAACSILSAVFFLGASCTLPLGPQGASILKTENYGQSWMPRAVLSLPNKKTATLTTVDVTRMKYSPQNADILFLGTKTHGLFASNNAGDSWIQLIPSQYVTDIGFDPSASCTLYVATPARILKTTDCGTVWQVVLNETRPNIGLTNVVVDPVRPKLVYVSTSAGDVFRTFDGGVTWSAVHRFPGHSIKRFILDPRNPRLMYYATNDGYIFKSVDQGSTWKDVSAALRQQFPSLEYRFFDVMVRRDRLMYASADAIYTTRNGGESWERMKLLTPEGSAHILAARVNPRDDTEFYYVTANTFYESHNTGINWIARLLLTDKTPSFLLVHPSRRGVVYLGLKKPVDESQYWYQQQQEY